MPIAAIFREISSGQRQGLAASFARGVLRIAEIPYSLAVGWRNRRYDRRSHLIHHVSVPVISVGNLTTGGTGKTPMVEWLARWYATRGVRVAFVSRGYGTKADTKNDEALELAQKLPDVPHVQNRDRVAAARTAIEQFHAQLIVVDDGFQHRRLHRDLDIVLIDALEPFGYGHLLPRGMLREPIDSLGRAHVVVLSRADLIDAQSRASIQETIRPHAPNATWIEVAHTASHLVFSTGETSPLDSLDGQRVAAFCGIGNPTGFRRTLERLDCTIADWREFPDHHSYSEADCTSLAAWCESLRPIATVLCTLKDLVKINRDRLGSIPLRAVVVGLQVQAGRSLLEERLQTILNQCKTP